MKKKIQIETKKEPPRQMNIQRAQALAAAQARKAELDRAARLAKYKL